MYIPIYTNIYIYISISINISLIISFNNINQACQLLPFWIPSKPPCNGVALSNKMHTGSRLFSTIAQDRHGSDTACNVSAGLDLLTTEPDYKIAITALTPALFVQNEQA